jgi:hypothetical protein
VVYSARFRTCFFLSVLTLLASCAPNLAVTSGRTKVSEQDDPDEFEDIEVSLADWTKCEDPNQAPTPTGPLRMSKTAYINYLFQFLNSGGTGNALPNYLSMTAPSHSPAFPMWQGDGLPDVSGIPEDLLDKSFYTTNHILTETHAQSYLSVAHNVASHIQSSTTALTRLIGNCHTEINNLDCLRVFLNRAFKTLFVRPPDSGEVERYFDFLKSLSMPMNEKWGVIVRSLLLHPDFIFVNPTRGTLISKNPRIYQLNTYELARKIAYALTASPPDKDLWDQAADGTLEQTEVLKTQVRRLLNPAVKTNPGGQHDATQHQFNKFYKDYLRPWEIGQTPTQAEDALAAASPNPPIYTFNNGYLTDIQAQEYAYFYEKIWTQQTFQNFLTDTQIPIAFYRIKSGINAGQSCPDNGNMIPIPSNPICSPASPATTCECYSGDWHAKPSYRAITPQLTLPVAENERTLQDKTVKFSIPDRPGILARHTFTHNPESKFYSHIIHSGQKVKSIFTCNPAPTPNFATLPADFRSLESRHLANTLSTAAWYKGATSAPVCMSCHHGVNGMESWGMVFNEYDGFSRKNANGIERVWSPQGGTPTEVPFDVNTEVLLDEKVQKITGVAALATALATSDQAQICFSRKIYTFLEGREATPQDSCSLKAMKTATAGESMISVIENYFTQPQFRLRRTRD